MRRDEHRAIASLKALLRDRFGLKWFGAFEAAAREARWLDDGAMPPSEREIAACVERALPKETALFRHSSHWPAIAATNATRVWSAGCATGEEAYSIALVLPKAKVLATDVAHSAIETARRGAVRRDALDRLPGVLRAFFRGADIVPRDAMSRITWRVHDLVRDPYPSPFDLIVCRNLLMYLDSDHKARVVERFADSLDSSGRLLLGSADRASALPPSLTREVVCGVVFFRKR